MRWEPSTGSRPTVDRNTPKAMAIRPLIGESPEMPESSAKANSRTAVYSSGPNSSAIAAKGTTSTIRRRSEIVSPVTEENSANLSARWDSPRFAIGWPSSAVAAASGVPGELSRMAGIAPPDVPPLLTPTRKAMAASGDM